MAWWRPWIIRRSRNGLCSHRRIKRLPMAVAVVVESSKQGEFRAPRRVVIQLQDCDGWWHRVMMFSSPLSMRKSLDMGKGAPLGFLDVLQKATGAGYGCVGIVAAETFEIMGLELALQ